MDKFQEGGDSCERKDFVGDAALGVPKCRLGIESRKKHAIISVWIKRI